MPNTYCAGTPPQRRGLVLVTQNLGGARPQPGRAGRGPAVRKSLARWDQAGNFGTVLDPEPDDAMIITSMHATATGELGAPPEDGGA